MDIVVRSVLPVVFALIVGGIILLALGKNPLKYYGDIVVNGVLGGNLQNSLVMMTPLLLMAIALIVVFRGQLWNLGYDGQYLLGAVFVGGLAPQLIPKIGLGPSYIALIVLSIAVAAAWTLVPAWLKARFGTNEIITTLVMSSIGVGGTGLLIEYLFQDPAQRTPQTRTMNTADMLPYIPGTKVHVGFIVAIVAAVVFQFILSRTSFGLRLDIFGVNPKAARHVGINSRTMTIVLFLISGGLIGLAAALDVMGQWGYVRNNWNPAYGDTIMPFVFLARLSPVGSIPFVLFYSIFATGGTVASIDSGLSTDFNMVIVALILVFMTITEYVGSKRELGQSYLPDELRDAVRRPFAALTGRSAQA
ncbi:ABC transporter permease [Gryllotalpicola koreensis]|uniref:ABC transporter permease n=1 Tax=Gryllotalpicola koreensis TaxID=993086 RepID=A0ABP7ZRQ3_9MICO